MSLDATADHSAHEGVSTMPAPQELTSKDQLDLILQSLDDDKAEEIVTINLAGKSSIGDYMIVCSGRSSRQVSSIADKLAEKIKHATGRVAKIEGKETGDWVLIDTGDIIVHVFRPEVREFYQLEKMWLQPGSPAPAI
nr:ribosome silencing factor [Pseudooceanicola spongiae]